MTNPEIAFAFIAMLVGVCLQYKIAFEDSTPKGSPFDFNYWWKDNKWDFVESIVVIILLFFSVSFTKVPDYYTTTVVSKYPILELIRPEAFIGGFIGYFGNKYLRKLLKSQNKKIDNL